MKSERRHELQKNELADWLGGSVEKIKPHLRLIVISVVALVAVVAVVVLLMRQQSAGVAEGWRDYLGAGSDSAVLRDVANRHEGTLPGLWARQSLADSELMFAMSRIFSDREEANKSLEIAKDAYREIIEAAGRRNAMLRQRAQFGLAQTYEALNDPKNALKTYDEIIEAAGDDAIVAEAKRRMARVRDLQSEKFYQWFASAEPPPPGSQAGMPGGSPFGQGMPGQDLPGLGADLPLDLTTIPETPDLSIPGTIDDAPLPSTGPVDIPVKPADDTPEDTTPAEDPPAEEKPADAAPAEEKPAEEKPAEDAPAEEKPADAPPAEDAPADDTPADDASADEKPAEAPPAAEPNE